MASSQRNVSTHEIVDLLQNDDDSDIEEAQCDEIEGKCLHNYYYISM